MVFYLYEYVPIDHSYHFRKQVTVPGEIQSFEQKDFTVLFEDVISSWSYAVYIGYYNEARDDEKTGETRRVNMDDGSVIYVYEWTDEGVNSDGDAYTYEKSLAVSSDGFISCNEMIYWNGGDRREISFYGYYSNARGLDDFVFEYKYTFSDGEVNEIRCDDINYSSNLSLTLNKAYVVDAPYSYKISEDEYMKEQFNIIYEWLRDDMARFK